MKKSCRVIAEKEARLLLGNQGLSERGCKAFQYLVGNTIIQKISVQIKPTCAARFA